MSNSNGNVRTELSNLLKKKFGEDTGRELFVEFIDKLDKYGNAERALIHAKMRSSYWNDEYQNVWTTNCDLVEVVMKLLQKQ